VTPTARHWTDWVGFVAYVAFATWLLTGMGTAGVLVALPVLFEFCVALAFLVRGRAQRSTHGWAPRCMTYVSAFLMPVFLRTALVWRPSLVTGVASPVLRLAGATLWLFGLVMGFWPLWHLRHAFSVEPAARELVMSGPYQIARHPIYACYAVNFLGICLLRLTVPVILVTVVWALVTYVRVGYEERVLAATFPAYLAYRKRVPAFGVSMRR
jgi:protein-S-isoprenylcysteine O-methyltransferase Ste14